MTGGFYRPREAVWPPRPPRRATAGRKLAAAGLWTLACALLALGGGLVVRFHPRFHVKRVVLSGVPEPRRAEVERLTDAWIGAPLLSVDLGAAVADLSRRPWVERAAARRVVPDTVVVSLAARPPVAAARRAGELWLVDRSGTWLGPLAPAVAAEDFVVIDPSGTGEGAEAEAAGAARGAAFVARLGEDDPELLARVSEVIVSRDGFVVVDKLSRTSLAFGSEALEPGQTQARWRAFLALVPELERHALLTRTVDLRFESRIVLRAPAGPSGKT